MECQIYGKAVDEEVKEEDEGKVLPLDSLHLTPKGGVLLPLDSFHDSFHLTPKGVELAIPKEESHP